MQYDAEIIQTRSLSRRFGDTTAVDALTLDIHRGEVFGFLGHNGAGKTTTVRLLNGILGPTAGSCRVLGLDPVSEGSALRRHTGVLIESPSLEERLTAREILSLYGRMYGVEKESLAPSKLRSSAIVSRSCNVDSSSRWEHRKVSLRISSRACTSRS